MEMVRLLQLSMMVPASFDSYTEGFPETWVSIGMLRVYYSDLLNNFNDKFLRWMSRDVRTSNYTPWISELKEFSIFLLLMALARVDWRIPV